MPQLDPTWFASQLFWLAVCFGFLYLVLSAVILPPLQGVIASRKGAVSADLEAAQALKREAENAKQTYERTLVQAREMAQALLAESENASKARSAAATSALDLQIVNKLAEAERSIALKKKALLEALTPASVEFASMIVEKLTKQAPTNEQVKSALNQAIKSK